MTRKHWQLRVNTARKNENILFPQCVGAPRGSCPNDRNNFPHRHFRNGPYGMYEVCPAGLSTVTRILYPEYRNHYRSPPYLAKSVNEQNEEVCDAQIQLEEGERGDVVGAAGETCPSGRCSEEKKIPLDSDVQHPHQQIHLCVPSPLGFPMNAFILVPQTRLSGLGQRTTANSLP